MITVRIDERGVRVARRNLPDSFLEAVWRGHIFLSDRQDRGYEVDRAANGLAEGLPGRPLALSDHYAIFGETYADEPRYSVHRLG